MPHENRSGQDVTSQYVDLQAQLKAKQAAEKKLLEIMDKATRAEDVLAIYLQVQTVQTEIEQLKGQIKYLEESAALSAISVQLIAEESTQPIVVGPWKPEGAAKLAIQDLIFFFQNFVDFLIRFVTIDPAGPDPDRHPVVRWSPGWTRSLSAGFANREWSLKKKEEVKK